MSHLDTPAARLARAEQLLEGCRDNLDAFAAADERRDVGGMAARAAMAAASLYDALTHLLAEVRALRAELDTIASEV